MRDRIRANAPILITAVLVAALTTGGPALAGAAFDAMNAHKVDGKHAVSATASAEQRAGKLVATGASGYLPNGIIKKARDADRLDGLESTAFVRSITGGGIHRVVRERLFIQPDASGNTTTVLTVPGLGRVDARCYLNASQVLYVNDTAAEVDFFKLNSDQSISFTREPNSGVVVADDTEPNAVFDLGFGTRASNDFRTATVHVFSRQDRPCVFQVHVTIVTG